MASFDNELERIVTQLNRAAPTPEKPVISQKIPPRVEGGLEQLLSFSGDRNASDLLLVAESPAIVRVSGSLTPATGAPLTPEDIENLLLPALNTDQQRELRTKKSLDFGFVRANGIRCRANVHYTCPPRWGNFWIAGRGWCWLPGLPAAVRRQRSPR
jgi:hypothetical protein